VLNSLNNCEIRLIRANALFITLRFSTTVEDFFNNNGDSLFIDKICAFLNIPYNSLRIANVRSGSVIIDAVITSPKNESESSQTEIEEDLK